MVNETVVFELEVGVRIEEFTGEVPLVQPLSVSTVDDFGGRWIVVLADDDLTPAAAGKLSVGRSEAIRIDVDQHPAGEGKIGRGRRCRVKERALENLNGAFVGENLGGLGVDLDTDQVGLGQEIPKRPQV